MQRQWEDLFAPWILARGKRYYEDARVTQITQQGNTIRATVAGTDAYTVEVDLPGGFPSFMSCTCPYGCRDNCKHMAALLFAVDAGTYTFTPERPDRTPFPLVPRVPEDDAWKETIDHLPASELRKLLTRAASHNPDLQQELILRHQGHLSDGYLQNRRADVQEIALSYCNRYGVLDPRELTDFSEEVQCFLSDILSPLRKLHAMTDAFRLTWTVWETVLELPAPAESKDLESLFSFCGNSMKKQFQNAAQAQKEEIHAWYRAYRADVSPAAKSTLDKLFAELPR